MKKMFVISVVALGMMLSACSLSGSGTNVDSSKVRLHTCLMEEGQKQLANGSLTTGTLTSIAKEISAICVAKLALNGSSTETVQLATEVLKTLVK